MALFNRYIDSILTNLNDISILDDCSEQLFVFRIILLLLQVSCMLKGKMGKKFVCTLIIITLIMSLHDICLIIITAFNVNSSLKEFQCNFYEHFWGNAEQIAIFHSSDKCFKWHCEAAGRGCRGQSG